MKQRIALKMTRTTTSSGEAIETNAPRADHGLNHLAIVRAFYLDLAEWAMDDPARWGVWAA
ncbi:hypothetical protein E1267_36640 [Nonomuraea longispora]|uniref:Uncharacterized protein n=2 Tax=Nonomuraea longispora TaxID=1848320 RepID=A0A4R4MYX7_9ACTN|nr:hypothetical protein E1267_36640 [Nonomuraea longispora]